MDAARSGGGSADRCRGADGGNRRRRSVSTAADRSDGSRQTRPGKRPRRVSQGSVSHTTGESGADRRRRGHASGPETATGMSPRATRLGMALSLGRVQRQSRSNARAQWKRPGPRLASGCSSACLRRDGSRPVSLGSAQSSEPIDLRLVSSEPIALAFAPEGDRLAVAHLYRSAKEPILPPAEPIKPPPREKVDQPDRPDMQTWFVAKAEKEPPIKMVQQANCFAPRSSSGTRGCGSNSSHCRSSRCR